MKKLFLAGLILFVAVVARGADYKQKYEYFRSSSPALPCTLCTISTGVVYVSAVQVTSGSAVGSNGNQSAITFFSGNGVSPNVFRSTLPLYDTSQGNVRYAIDQVFTGSFTYTSVGVSSITIYWDWMYFVPPGQENKGRN